MASKRIKKKSLKDFVTTGTHIPVLCRCFNELKDSKGRILEVGLGMYSTPILHELARDRKLVSLENHLGWFHEFIIFDRNGDTK